jgi:phosphatidate cytidylyltransferase
MVRLVSGLTLAAVVLAAIRFLPVAALTIVAVCVAALAAHEFLPLVGTRDRPRQVAAIAATAALCALVAMQVRLDPAALFAGALAWIAVEVLATGRTIQQAAAALVAPLYIGVPLGMLVVVHVVRGWRATLLIVVLVIVSDSAQYYAGRAFGRHALAPAISPKKTIEGAAGGLVCGTVFMAAAGSWPFPGAGMLALGGLGAAVVALGVCGDLFESRVKRTAGVKDSSSLIPGHGGMLDRIDALLFAAPAFYLFVRSLE